MFLQRSHKGLIKVARKCLTVSSAFSLLFQGNSKFCLKDRTHATLFSLELVCIDFKERKTAATRKDAASCDPQEFICIIQCVGHVNEALVQSAK